MTRCETRAERWWHYAELKQSSGIVRPKRPTWFMEGEVVVTMRAWNSSDLLRRMRNSFLRKSFACVAHASIIQSLKIRLTLKRFTALFGSTHTRIHSCDQYIYETSSLRIKLSCLPIWWFALLKNELSWWRVRIWLGAVLLSLCKWLFIKRFRPSGEGFRGNVSLKLEAALTWQRHLLNREVSFKSDCCLASSSWQRLLHGPIMALSPTKQRSPSGKVQCSLGGPTFHLPCQDDMILLVKWRVRCPNCVVV